MRYTSTLAPYHYFGKIKSQPAFLRIIEDGHIKLLERRRTHILANERVVIPDYYLVDEAENLYRLSGRDVKDLSTFLKNELKMRESFFEAISYEISIRNLKYLIMDYNDWILMPSQNPKST